MSLNKKSKVSKRKAAAAVPPTTPASGAHSTNPVEKQSENPTKRKSDSQPELKRPLEKSQIKLASPLTRSALLCVMLHVREALGNLSQNFLPDTFLLSPSAPFRTDLKRFPAFLAACYSLP